MQDTYNTTNNTVYVKSNTATVVCLLSFLAVVLFVVVAGLSAYVFFTNENQQVVNFDQAKQFYFTIENDCATITKFVDSQAETCVVPESIRYNGHEYPVVAIGKNAFTDHRCLKKVALPNSVTKIMGNRENQTGAFSGCTVLSSVSLGTGLNYIDEYTFSNCVALLSIEIPVNVQFVCEYAFENCLSLNSIQLDGNGTLKPGCFENCLHVEKLYLMDNVKLTNENKQALVDLTGLKCFEVIGADSIYQVSDSGDCLLTATNTKNDTVVLGGRNAVLPDGVTQITSWAWGKRASDNFFVPATVIEIGQSAFYQQNIYTDAVSVANWSVDAVCFKAQLITFYALGESVDAYVYDNVNGEKVYPQFDDLFPGLKTETPFDKWEIIDDVTYNAKFQDKTKGTDTIVAQYNSELLKSQGYIQNTSVQKYLSIDFWEKFKSAFYSVVNVNPELTYDYLLKEYRATLNNFNNQIDQAIDESISREDKNQAILESEEWKTRLTNLIARIDEIDVFDLDDVQNNFDLMEKIEKLTEDAMAMLNSSEHSYNDESFKEIWTALRGAYEDLVMDVSSNGRLGSLISQCECLDANQYTNESWKNLQNCLNEARQITEHNQSITIVREKLQQAYDDLSELLSDDIVAEFKAWYMICKNLNPNDYQNDIYNELWFKLLTIDEDDLENDSKIETLVANLKADYSNLIPLTSESNQETSILNLRTLPFFILSSILFVGAVLAISTAVKLKHQLRRNRE